MATDEERRQWGRRMGLPEESAGVALRVISSELVRLTEEAGADAIKFAKTPLGEVAVRECGEGRMSPAAYQDIVRRLLVFNPQIALQAKAKTPTMKVTVSEVDPIALPPSTLEYVER